jgi:N6-L-threonylcarbamoyladenine synthase
MALLEAKGGLSAPKFKILNHIVASQIKIHEPFGGVVPNIAKREHIKNLPVLYKKIFGTNVIEKRNWKKIDLIAVTVGPGLEPALWAGIEFAKVLSKTWKKPLIGANHMEGHLWSFLLARDAQRDANMANGIRMPRIGNKNNSQHSRKLADSHRLSSIFPAVALLVSGGHTILLLMKDIKTWKKLGETRDDAVGEAFDKVARILHLPYPGGPQIEKLAREGNENAISFPRPMMHDKNYDFSYSGLKTSVLYYCRDNPAFNPADVAASFQNAATEVLIKKAMRAAKEFSAKGGSASGGKVKSIILSGGVAANSYLREKLGNEVKKEKMLFLVPGFTFNTDNAAMIGAAGYFNYSLKKKYPLRANGDLSV